jgi:uncharacterized delta-60 repeat protein
VREVASETAPSPSWSQHQDGNTHFFDYSEAVTTDTDGNVYVTGTADNDYLTVKYSPTGARLWTARYSGPANGLDSPAAIAVDADGSVYVTGASFGGLLGSGGTDYDIATVKYDAAGGEAWVRRYNGSGNKDDEGLAIQLDPEGNVLVAGFGSELTTAWDYVLLKYSPAGDHAWTARYDAGNSGADRARALGVDAAGNAYLTGHSWSDATHYDYATVQFTPAGAQGWVARYNGPANASDAATAIEVAADGGVWVTGASTGTGNTDFATVRYSPAGVQQWAMRHNGLGNDIDEALAITADTGQNTYVTGITHGGGSGYDYLTIKYGPTGAELWRRTFTGTAAGNDEARSVAVDASGSVYVTGYGAAPGNSLTFATLKYAADGTLLWTARYEGPVSGPSGGTALVVAPNGDLVVTGNAWTSAGGQDFATVRYPAPPPPAPAFPTAFTAVLNGSQVQLSWQHPGTNLTGFILERKTAVTAYSSLSSPAAADRAYLDTAVMAGGQYTYRLRAAGPGGESASVISTTVTIPGGVPGKLKAPKKINFGNVRVGRPRSVKVKLANAGKGVLSGTVAVTGPFPITSGSGAFTLAPKKSVTLVLQFAPQAAGAVTGSLQIQSDDPTQPTVAVPITAKGL